MKSKAYPTDLTDEQWTLMERFFPEPKPEGRTGRPREYSYREIVSGIFSVLRTGCTWEMMPTICRRKHPAITISGSSAMTAPGRSATTRCESKSEPSWIENPLLPPPFSTANR